MNQADISFGISDVADILWKLYSKQLIVPREAAIAQFLEQTTDNAPDEEDAIHVVLMESLLDMVKVSNSIESLVPVPKH